MEDLKIAGYGKANGGNFNKIVINGYGEIFESAICKDFYGTGTAKIHGQLATGSLKYTGDTFIENHLTANSIDMTGKLDIKGDVNSPIISICGDMNILGNCKGENIKITGTINSYGNITCENFKANGTITIKEELCAENVDIKSCVIDINEIHATKVIITKPFTLGIRKKTNNINEIECTTIEAELLNCKKLCAHHVKLSKNCVVDSLEYSGDLELEDGCMIKELIKIA